MKNLVPKDEVHCPQSHKGFHSVVLLGQENHHCLNPRYCRTCLYLNNILILYK